MGPEAVLVTVRARVLVPCLRAVERAAPRRSGAQPPASTALWTRLGLALSGTVYNLEDDQDRHGGVSSVARPRIPGTGALQSYLRCQSGKIAQVARARLRAHPEVMAETNSSEALSWLEQWQQEATDKRLPEAIRLDALISLIDARTKNAYDSALRQLTRQDQTLSNIRNRASGVLTVATLITSLAASLGFLKNGTSMGPQFPNWAKWALFGILLAMILLHLVTTWPIKRIFGANPEAVLWFGEIPPEGPIRKSLVGELIKCAKNNEKWITICARLYQAQAFGLVAEVVIIIIATMRG